MGDLDGIILKTLARPLGAGRKERHGVLVIGDDVVQLQANRAARDLEAPAKPPDHLSHAFEVATERAPAGEMPADVLGEELVLQCVEVASPESREAFSHQILVRMCHLIPPLDQSDRTIFLRFYLAVKLQRDSTSPNHCAGSRTARQTSPAHQPRLTWASLALP